MFDWTSIWTCSPTFRGIRLLFVSIFEHFFLWRRNCILFSLFWANLPVEAQRKNYRLANLFFQPVRTYIFPA